VRGIGEANNHTKDSGRAASYEAFEVPVFKKRCCEC